MTYKNLTEGVSDSLLHAKTNDVIANTAGIDNSLLDTKEKVSALLNSTSNQKVILKHDIKKLDIPTYEGSGHACHPSVVYTPYGFNGYNYWMAFTPYPNGDAQHENPSILCSNDGLNWQVPSGLTNPITGAPTNGYNSDTCLVYDPKTPQLICYYRPVIDGQSIIVRKTSSDGVNWSAEEPCSGTENVLSPQVIMLNTNDFLMVGQKGGDFIAHTSANGIDFELKEKNKMDIPDMLWHLGACKTTTGFLFTLCTFNYVGSNANTRLYFGSSRNGLNPTLISDTPIVDPKDFYNLQIYQSVLTETEDGMRLYISSQSDNGAWDIGYADVILSEPLYATDGIVNRHIKAASVTASSNETILSYERTYGAKEIRVLVHSDSDHDYEVDLRQHVSTGTVSEVINTTNKTNAKADLFSNSFSVKILNNDTLSHNYSVSVLLIK